jgi:hypothetical protein
MPFDHRRLVTRFSENAFLNYYYTYNSGQHVGVVTAIIAKSSNIVVWKITAGVVFEVYTNYTQGKNY